MTPKEFKAWFDGFTEALTGCPNKAQWTRIKERVAEIDGAPVTERVFVDRYWPLYNGGYVTGPVYTPTLWPPRICGNAVQAVTGDTVTISSFDGCSAMYALGCNDAQALVS